MFPFRQTVLLTLIACLHCGGGELKNPFAKPTPIDPCDPTGSVYVDKEHYIDREHLNDDGTLNYLQIFNARKAQASECDPLR